MEGRLQIRSFDGNDGQRRWVTEVIADNVEFLSSGQGGQNKKQEQDGADWGQEIVFDSSDVPF